MTWRVDVRSMVIGGLLVGGLVLLIGAAGDEPAKQVGRYQVAAATSTAYVIDTMTGRLWQRSDSGFLAPKPAIENDFVGTQSVKDYLGSWVLSHGSEEDLSIRLDRGGRCVLKEGAKTWEARWRVDGDHLLITSENATLATQLDEDGRLLVREGTGTPLPFEKAR